MQSLTGRTALYCIPRYSVSRPIFRKSNQISTSQFKTSSKRTHHRRPAALSATAALQITGPHSSSLVAQCLNSTLNSTLDIGPLRMLGVAAAFVIFLFTIKLIRLIRAHADLQLLSKTSPPPDAFQNKVVWVVGASQGLGKTMARHFARAGAHLIISSRSLEKLELVKTACAEYSTGRSIICLPLDLTGPPEELEIAAATAFAAFDGVGVDYIIHNAGASQHAAAEETNVDVSESLIDLNMLGPIALTRATLPLMVQRKSGRHVVVASMAAVVPSPGQATYSAAKAGLRAYFLSVASELAASGVGVTVCCPGPISTGNDNQVRTVYGPKGMIPQRASTGGKPSKRVDAQIAAELIARAAYHKLDECWIGYHPVLLMGYLMQYLPWLGMLVLKRVGPGRVRQLRDGSGSGYDVGRMLSR